MKKRTFSVDELTAVQNSARRIRDEAAMCSRLDFGDVLSRDTTEEFAISGLTDAMLRVVDDARIILDVLNGGSEDADE